MTTTPTTFRKKPVEIEAMQTVADAPTLHAISCWMEDGGAPFLVGNATEPATLRRPDQDPDDTSRPDAGHYIDPATGELVIRTLEGDMHANLGDWIIRGVQGEFYPCKPDIFAESYERVV